MSEVFYGIAYTRKKAVCIAYVTLALRTGLLSNGTDDAERFIWSVSDGASAAVLKCHKNRLVANFLVLHDSLNLDLYLQEQISSHLDLSFVYWMKACRLMTYPFPVGDKIIL